MHQCFNPWILIWPEKRTLKICTLSMSSHPRILTTRFWFLPPKTLSSTIKSKTEPRILIGRYPISMPLIGPDATRNCSEYLLHLSAKKKMRYFSLVIILYFSFPIISSCPITTYLIWIWQMNLTEEDTGEDHDSHLSIQWVKTELFHWLTWS